MNKKILICSIIAVAILGLISLNPVVGMSFENSTDMQQSLNPSEKITEINTNNMGIWLLHTSITFISGEVSHLEYSGTDPDYWLYFKVVNLTVTGISYYKTENRYYWSSYELNESKDWGFYLWQFSSYWREPRLPYIGFNMLRLEWPWFPEPTVYFLHGILRGGTFWYKD